MRLLLLGFAFLLFCDRSAAQQKTLAVLGSSTAAGVGASTPSNSWVAMVSEHFTTNGLLGTTHNLSLSGSNPYIAMPTGYDPPTGRPDPQEDHNITRAIQLGADIVIVSFVSNNFNTANDSLSDAEVRFTLESICNEAAANGMSCFVTTTQPRTGFGTTGRDRLRRLKDSIINWFGPYAINFFDPLVNPADNTIQEQYRFSGDNIHINDAGHEVLYQQVISNGLLAAALPVKLLDFSATAFPPGVTIRWKATDEESSTQYELQRSSDGQHFSSILSMKAKKEPGINSYEHIDRASGQRELHYRLYITENERKFYSPIARVQVPVASGLTLSPVPAGGEITVGFESPRDGKINVTIFNMNGAQLAEHPLTASKGWNSFRINVGSLPKGQLLLKLASSFTTPQTIRFLKL